MDVKVISNEMIKPSSPTPENLRLYKLSFLDQMTPRVYCPFIYYYSSKEPKSKVNGHHDRIVDVSKILKESLSKALTLYYPLAGRVVSGAGNFLVQCNDEGALFTQAIAGEKLVTVLETPVNMFDLNKLLPASLDEIPKLPLAVQVTAFSCGGVTIGVCVDHFIGDALSSLIFLQNWAAIARGEDTIPPEFISGDIIPANPTLGNELGVSSGAFKGMCAATSTKRFVFTSSKIEALRIKVSGSDITSEGKPASRVSVLSAFLWTRFKRSIGLAEEGNPAKAYAVILAANIRSKFDPPLPNHSFGNYYALSPTTGPLLESTDNLDGDYRSCQALALRLGQDLRKIDGRYIGFLRENGAGLLGSIKKEQARVLSGEVVGFFLSSLSRFPIYEADFGFGKPVWVSSAARGFQNGVTFFDKKDGDGIEAFICLKHEDMEKLEADQEFLSFVTSSSPIID